MARPLHSLADLEAMHAAPHAGHEDRARARFRARGLCKRTGVECPTWALVAPTPAHKPSRKGGKRVSAPAAGPVTWTRELGELRRALPAGTAVGLSGRGVVLDVIGRGRLAFASVDAALEWATAP